MQNDSSVGEGGSESVKKSKSQRSFRWGTIVFGPEHPFWKLHFPVYKSWSKGAPFYAVAFKLPNGDRARVATDDPNDVMGLIPKIEARIEEAKRAKEELWGEDALMWRLAKKALALVKVPLNIVVSEWLWAKEKLGDVSIREAVEGYLKYKPTPLLAITVKDLGLMYLKEGTRSAKASSHYSSLFNQLAVFLKKDKVELVSKVKYELLRKWMEEPGYKMKTRKHRRGAAVTLLNYAKRKGALPFGPTEADKLPTISRKQEGRGLPEIFMPEEIRKMVETFWPRRQDPVYQQMLLLMVIGAFSGVRPKEIERMRWKFVVFSKNQIYLPREITKDNRYREIPLEPNLRAFLLALKPKDAGDNDLIVRGRCPAVHLSVRTKQLGIAWRHDGMRHSYATYRIARGDDINGLVMAMGTSSDVLYSNYRGRVRCVEDAGLWFALFPPANVAPLPPPARSRAVVFLHP